MNLINKKRCREENTKPQHARPWDGLLSREIHGRVSPEDQQTVMRHALKELKCTTNVVFGLHCNAGTSATTMAFDDEGVLLAVYSPKTRRNSTV